MSVTPAPVSPATNTAHILYAVAGNAQASVSASVEAPDIKPEHELDTQKQILYGASTVSAPNSSLTLQEREQRIDAYAGRVVTHIKQIESGSEGQSNVKFQKVRQFLEPGGYFSGGLLAAGYDPHEKFEVTFQTWTGVGKPDKETGREKRSYFAWEIAAGALAHDKVLRGGPINFQSMHIEQQDRSKISDLETVGQKLQKHWENEIAQPMRDVSGRLAYRSGRADAYVVRGTLQSLVQDKSSFEKLSPEGQEAVNRTLHKNGEVIIPNLYGYPLAGYAFIPYTPYDGNFEHRPNKGLMIDLKNGAVSEIQGDEDFAHWAKNNQANLLRSFNASDMQGSKDAHWPKAWDILDNLVSGSKAHYPGYSSLLKDTEVPVAETFNYTKSRKSEYQLKYGNLNTIASRYQEVNTKNAIWSDQTEVFGSSQQNWKAAKDLWGSTFGYLPVTGNLGNIVFGIHDAIYGKTADDRVGGGAAAVISGLQLAHEFAMFGAEAGLEDPAIAQGSSAPRPYNWKYNEGTRDFDLVHTSKTTNPSELPGQKPSVTAKEPDVSLQPGIDEPVAGPSNGKPIVHEPTVPAPPNTTTLVPISQYAVTGGEELISDTTPNAKGIYQVKGPRGEERWLIRLSDETDVSRVYEIEGRFKLRDGYVRVVDPATKNPVITVQATGEGEWEVVSGLGGQRKPKSRPALTDSPVPSSSANQQLANHPDWQSVVDSGMHNGQPVYIHYTDKAGAEAIAREHAINDTARGDTRPGSKSGVYVNPANQQFNGENVENLLFLGNERYVGRGDYMVIFSTDQVPNNLGAVTSGSPFVELKMPKQIKLTPSNFVYSGPNGFPDYFS